MTQGSSLLARCRATPVRVRRFLEPRVADRMAEWHLQAALHSWRVRLGRRLDRGVTHGALLGQVLRHWRSLSRNDQALLLENVLRVPITTIDLERFDDQASPDTGSPSTVDPPTG